MPIGSTWERQICVRIRIDRLPDNSALRRRAMQAADHEQGLPAPRRDPASRRVLNRPSEAGAESS